jgi:hypothetical protein
MPLFSKEFEEFFIEYKSIIESYISTSKSTKDDSVFQRAQRFNILTSLLEKNLLNNNPEYLGLYNIIHRNKNNYRELCTQITTPVNAIAQHTELKELIKSNPGRDDKEKTIKIEEAYFRLHDDESVFNKFKILLQITPYSEFIKALPLPEASSSPSSKATFYEKLIIFTQEINQLTYTVNFSAQKDIKPITQHLKNNIALNVKSILNENKISYHDTGKLEKLIEKSAERMSKQAYYRAMLDPAVSQHLGTIYIKGIKSSVLSMKSNTREKIKLLNNYLKLLREQDKPEDQNALKNLTEKLAALSISFNEETLQNILATNAALATSRPSKSSTTLSVSSLLTDAVSALDIERETKKNSLSKILPPLPPRPKRSSTSTSSNQEATTEPSPTPALFTKNLSPSTKTTALSTQEITGLSIQKEAEPQNIPKASEF